MFGGMDRKGRLRQGHIPAKPRFRSVPDAAVPASSKGLLLEYVLALS